MKKRILSTVLAFLMLVSAIPAITIFSFAEESESQAQAQTQETVDYDSLYAKLEYLDTQIDFFSATASSDSLETDDLGKAGGAYVHKGGTSSKGPASISYSEKYTLMGTSTSVTGITHYEKYKPAYFGNGYLDLSYKSVVATDANGVPYQSDGKEVKYAVGSLLYLNTGSPAFYEKDENLQYTYEYVVQVNEINNSTTPANDATYSQFICNTFGRITLYYNYNASEATLYPVFYTFLYVDKLDANGNVVVKADAYGTAKGSQAGQKTSITKTDTKGKTSIKMGQDFTVAITANVYTENGKWLTQSAKNGVLSGKVYMNSDSFDYTRNMYDTETGEQFKAQLYGNVATHVERNDSAYIFAIRRYTTELSKDELAQNRFVDVAKFYQLDASLVNEVFALDEDMRLDVFNLCYSIRLTRDESIESKAGVTAKIRELVDEMKSSMMERLYENLYAAQDSLFYNLCFFDAKESEVYTDKTELEKLIKEKYLLKGTTVTLNAPSYVLDRDEEGYVKAQIMDVKNLNTGVVSPTVVLLSKKSSADDFSFADCNVSFGDGYLQLGKWEIEGKFRLYDETGEVVTTNEKYPDGIGSYNRWNVVYYGQATLTTGYTINSEAKSFYPTLTTNNPGAANDHSYQIISTFGEEGSAASFSNQAIQLPTHRLYLKITNGALNIQHMHYSKKGGSWNYYYVITQTEIPAGVPFDYTATMDVVSSSLTAEEAMSNYKAKGYLNIYANGNSIFDPSYYATSQESADSNYWYVGDISMSSIGTGSAPKIYSIRIYTKALTESEIEQNHFADIAKFYRLDVSKIEELPNMFKKNLYGIFNEYTVGDNEVDASALQAILDENIDAILDSSEDMFGASAIVNFIGYQARVSSYNGLRAMYSVDETALATLESQGYDVEFGALVTLADGKTAESITVSKDENGNTVANEGVSLTEIYNTSDKYVGKIYRDESGKVSFVLTVTYTEEDMQTVRYYRQDLIYKTYIAVTDRETNETVFIYPDNSSDLFGESVNMFKVANHFVNNSEQKYTILQKVVKVCNDDLPALEYVINGKKVENYTIVISDEKYRDTAEQLQRKLYALTEYELPISDSPLYYGIAINVGKKDTANVWEYKIEAKGSVIDLYGSGTSGAQYAIEEFEDMLKEGNELTVEGASYDANEFRVDGKTYAMDTFFDGNGKLTLGEVAEPKIVYATFNEIPDEVKEEGYLVMTFLGASNSEGGKEYFALFAQAVADTLKRNVVYYNAGVGGTKTTLSAPRFYQSVGQYAPDIVVFDENSNDTSSSKTIHQTYVESVLYQVQQLDKIPVVIFNQIPRPNESDSAVVANSYTMIENKTQVTSYYGISNIDIYSSLQERYKEVIADLEENGEESEYYATYTKAFSDLVGKYSVFSTYLDTLKNEKTMTFLGYLAVYYNLTAETTSTTPAYNVHPKQDGYKLFGEVMTEKFLADPALFLANMIMPEGYDLYAPENTSLVKAQYNLIGADGTVLTNGEENGEKREIIYSSTEGVSDWNIYSADSPYTPEGSNKSTAENYNPNYDKERLLVTTEGFVYKTPYFANGIAQCYNKSGASFSFKTTADEISFYRPMSGVGSVADVVVTNKAGEVIPTTVSTVTCYENVTASFGRLADYIKLPGDGEEYTVTLTVRDATSDRYIFRFGYIIERYLAE